MWGGKEQRCRWAQCVGSRVRRERALQGRPPRREGAKSLVQSSDARWSTAGESSSHLGAVVAAQVVGQLVLHGVRARRAVGREPPPGRVGADGLELVLRFVCEGGGWVWGVLRVRTRVGAVPAEPAVHGAWRQKERSPRNHSRAVLPTLPPTRSTPHACLTSSRQLSVRRAVSSCPSATRHTLSLAPPLWKAVIRYSAVMVDPSSYTPPHVFARKNLPPTSWSRGCAWEWTSPQMP